MRSMFGVAPSRAGCPSRPNILPSQLSAWKKTILRLVTIFSLDGLVSQDSPDCIRPTPTLRDRQYFQHSRRLYHKSRNRQSVSGILPSGRRVHPSDAWRDAVDTLGQLNIMTTSWVNVRVCKIRLKSWMTAMFRTFAGRCASVCRPPSRNAHSRRISAGVFSRSRKRRNQAHPTGGLSRRPRPTKEEEDR